MMVICEQLLATLRFRAIAVPDYAVVGVFEVRVYPFDGSAVVVVDVSVVGEGAEDAVDGVG